MKGSKKIPNVVEKDQKSGFRNVKTKKNQNIEVRSAFMPKYFFCSAFYISKILLAIILL